MARRSHDDDDAEKSRFRWLDAARYAVAAVVTVLIVAVIANAIKVVLRPDTLRVTVVGGSVTAKPSSSPPTNLSLSFNLLTQNPSGRAVMHYTNVTGYLFDNSTLPVTPRPSDKCFVLFDVPAVEMLQGRQVNNFVRVTVKKVVSMESAYFDLVSGGGIIRGVTMRLDGNVTTEMTSVATSTTTSTIFYCPQLVVGGDPDDPAYKGGSDVLCTSDVKGGGGRLLRFWFSMIAAAMVALIQTFVM